VATKVEERVAGQLPAACVHWQHAQQLQVPVASFIGPVGHHQMLAIWKGKVVFFLLIFQSSRHSCSRQPQLPQLRPGFHCLLGQWLFTLMWSCKKWVETMILCAKYQIAARTILRYVT
jgi:hypothetical protein